MSNKNKIKGLLFKSGNSSIEKIKHGLNTKIIGREIFYFKTISSTNDYARNLVNKGVKEGTVVLADVQTSGRGRKNRCWFSSEGGLWFSVILFPNLPPKQGMLLTMTASISLAQAISDITCLKSLIKWPNDVLIDGKKVCGVLTELEADKEKISYSVVGIGFNVNNKLTEDLYKTAATLSEKIGSKISNTDLLICILRRFDENYTRLLDGDFGYITDKWLSMSKIVGRNVIIREDNTTIKGVVSGIDHDGSLILKTKIGTERIYSGDLEYI